MKRFLLIAFLLAAVLSIALAGCGGGGSTPVPTPTPTPTSTPTTGPITEDEMNILLDKTEQAMMRNALPTECFAEPDVDCGVLGRWTPQAIIDYFGPEAAFSSFEITGIITGPDTLQLQLKYNWTGKIEPDYQGPCDVQVTKTLKGWLLSSFYGVLQFFPKSTVQSHILSR